MNLLKTIRQLLRGYEEPNLEDWLSPACSHLLKSCCGFEEDATIEAIGIYPEENTLVAIFTCPDDKKIEVTFIGVVDASVTYQGKALTRNDMVNLPYEHDVDEFEVRGTCLYRDRGKVFHTHILKLLAEDLIVMFTFANLFFKEVIGAHKGAD